MILFVKQIFKIFFFLCKYSIYLTIIILCGYGNCSNNNIKNKYNFNYILDVNNNFFFKKKNYLFWNNHNFIEPVSRNFFKKHYANNKYSDFVSKIEKNNNPYFFNTKTPITSIMGIYNKSFYDHKIYFINNINENLNYSIYYNKQVNIDNDNYSNIKSLHITSNYKNKYYNIWGSLIKKVLFINKINKYNNINLLKVKNQKLNFFQSYKIKNNIFLYNINYISNNISQNREIYPYYNSNIKSHIIKYNFFHEKKLRSNINIISGVGFNSLYYYSFLNKNLTKINSISINNNIHYSINKIVFSLYNKVLLFYDNYLNNIYSTSLYIEYPLFHKYKLKYNLIFNKIPIKYKSISELNYNYIYFINKKLHFNSTLKNLNFNFIINDISRYKNVLNNTLHNNNILLYYFDIKLFFIYNKIYFYKKININMINNISKINTDITLSLSYKDNFFNKKMLFNASIITRCFIPFININDNYSFNKINNYFVFFKKQNNINNKKIATDVIINIKIFRIKTFIEIKNILFNYLLNIKIFYRELLFNIGFSWNLFS